MDPKFIDLAEGQIVILTRADYDALLARAVDVDEDAEDLAIGEKALADWKAGGSKTTPPEVAHSSSRATAPSRRSGATDP